MALTQKLINEKFNIDWHYEKSDNTYVYTFDPSNVLFKDTIKKALNAAFKDFNFRTITGGKSKLWTIFENSSQYNVKQNGVIGGLVEKLDFDNYNGDNFITRFVDYFSTQPKAQSDFDNWHYKTCELFQNIISPLYTLGKAKGAVTFGKAQKIVNMMFKHLYCLMVRDHTDERYFTYCHMPLDSFILEWFTRRVSIPEEMECVYEKTPGCVMKRGYGSKYKYDFEKGKRGEWSHIEYDASLIVKNNFHTYNYYRDTIRLLVIDEFQDDHNYYIEDPAHIYTTCGYNKLTPLEAEFFIWKGIQLEQAAEAFLLSLSEQILHDKLNGDSNAIMNYVRDPTKGCISNIRNVLNNSPSNLVEARIKLFFDQKTKKYQDKTIDNVITALKKDGLDEKRVNKIIANEKQIVTYMTLKDKKKEIKKLL